MTVAELIEKLKAMPQDLPVRYADYYVERAYVYPTGRETYEVSAYDKAHPYVVLA